MGFPSKRAMRFELTTFTLATCKTCLIKEGCDKNLDATACCHTPNMHQTPGTDQPDPDLAALIIAWQKLPIAIKASISAMIETIIEKD